MLLLLNIDCKFTEAGSFLICEPEKDASGGLRPKTHNQALDHYDGHDLIAFQLPVIVDKTMYHVYLYTFHITDELPYTLEDLYRASLYAWTLRHWCVLSPKDPSAYHLLLIPFKPAAA